MPKVGFVSLGCPKNLVDSEVMMGILARAGYELTPRAGEADVLSHPDHTTSAGARQLRRAIGRGIIDNHDFRERNRLPADTVEKTFQQVRAIVDGDDRGKHSTM